MFLKTSKSIRKRVQNGAFVTGSRTRPDAVARSVHVVSASLPEMDSMKATSSGIVGHRGPTVEYGNADERGPSRHLGGAALTIVNTSSGHAEERVYARSGRMPSRRTAGAASARPRTTHSARTSGGIIQMPGFIRNGFQRRNACAKHIPVAETGI